MIVALKTNRPEYRNDIAEEIRLFLGPAEIVEAAEGASYIFTVTLETRDDRFFARAAALNGPCATAETAVEGTDRLERKRQEKRALKIAAFRLLRMLFPLVAVPWGSLTGIRPTKLLRELARSHGEAEARRQLAEIFDVTAEKVMLAAEIYRVQQPFLASADAQRDLDVYIGIPFCRTRCLYCSFASEVIGKGEKLVPYLQVLREDIADGAHLMRTAGLRARALYIGGGTPTVLSAAQLDDLLALALDCYGGFSEITVEAGRPDTITPEKLAVLRAHGVGRISINPQTMNDETLRRIGRGHDAADVERCFAAAREVGFAAINMDLIAGLPGEDAAAFSQTLRRIAAMRPENLTVHTLALKRASRLMQERGEWVLPDADVTGAMLSAGATAARSLGMRPYYMYRQKYMSGNLENTGYALPGMECAYNIDMMEETISILAHGACGMSKRVFDAENRVERIPNPKDIATYCQKLPELLERKRRLFCGRSN